MIPFKTLITIALSLSLSLNIGAQKIEKSIIKQGIKDAVAQYTLQTNIIDKNSRFINPCTIDSRTGKILYIPKDDWRVGFFPGSMWQLYRLTADKSWKNKAERYTLTLDSIKYLTSHHDIGFIIGCSYLNGYRITGNEAYKPVIIQAARSLCTRFRPHAGIIQSWDVVNNWQAARGWKCPVIIDNMMNLELLFAATQLSGDSTYYNIAVKHADTTLAHHFRADNSCYHVVDYDPQTGAVLHRQTAQGYADESAWARGQAWSLYGYTMCYRYTKNLKYLHQAQKVCDFILNNKHLPADLVPYWDYDAPKIPNEPRDVSSAACTASALYELDTYLPGKHYRQIADKIMKSLSTPAYMAKVGTNGNFILMHSVGSLPHHAEVDVPLNYADYYYLEALWRMKNHKIY